MPLSERSSDDYRPLYHCAAEACERTRDDGHLERTSSKGRGCPFVGLCADHYGRSAVLKPAAWEQMQVAHQRHWESRHA